MRSSSTLGSVAFGVAVVVLAACLGEDPQVGPPDVGGQVDGGSTPPTADGSTGPGTCKGDTIDACGASCTKCTAPAGGTVECIAGACAKKCSGGQTLCGDTCIDTTASADHCGKCDHACGAGKCTDGACQPFPVASGFTEVHAIAMGPTGLVISADSDVSLCTKPEGCTAATALTTLKAGVSQLNDVAVAGNDVYFDGNEGDSEIVYKCPVAGCPGGGPTIVENVVNDSIGRVVAGPTEVVWTRYQSYYGPYSRRCTLPGCASIADVRPKPTTGPYYDMATREMTVPSKIVSVGAVSTLWATGALYNDNYKQLRACGLASPCPTPTEIDTAAAYIVALTYHDGKHYAATGTGTIFSVSDAAPTAARTPLVTDTNGITDVAVDASGIYWVNGTTGKVLRCANLAGCQGAGETLATGQTGAKKIRLDAKFVYWATTTSVLKVAK